MLFIIDFRNSLTSNALKDRGPILRQKHSRIDMPAILLGLERQCLKQKG